MLISKTTILFSKTQSQWRNNGSNAQTRGNCQKQDYKWENSNRYPVMRTNKLFEGKWKHKQKITFYDNDNTALLMEGVKETSMILGRNPCHKEETWNQENRGTYIIDLMLHDTSNKSRIDSKLS